MAEPEEIVIEPTRKFQGKFSSSLAARAELFYALRKMSDEDYHAGRRVTVNCLYREGYELVYKTASYRIGGKPRPERSWEVMSRRSSARDALMKPQVQGGDVPKGTSLFFVFGKSVFSASEGASRDVLKRRLPACACARGVERDQGGKLAFVGGAVTIFRLIR